MATWKCIVCNWDNAEKWEKCAKCGTVRLPFSTNAEAELFRKLQHEVKTIKAEIDKYQISVAVKWEYLQISSDEIYTLGGIRGFWC